jgi:RHS repeat-associated protein
MTRDDALHTYQWDAEGRMVSIDNGSTARYVYNALGQRVEKQLGSAYTEMVYDAFGSMTGTNNRSSWLAYFAPSGGVKYQDNKTYFLHGNLLGSTSFVTDEAATPIQKTIYYPYGQLWASAGTTKDSRFASMDPRDDTETGNDPTLFRMYNSRFYRWMSPDPLAGDITDPQSLNRYAYVSNNPATLTDPLGLCGEPGGLACDPPPIQTPASEGSRWYACMSASPWCPNGLYDTSPFAVDPSDPCSTWMQTNASCQQMPGLYNNGQPIYNGGGGFDSPWPIDTGYGPIQPLPPGQLLGLLLPEAPEECEFGACGGPTWNPFVSDVSVVNGNFTMYATVWELMELPLNLAALRNAGRIAAPVASPAAPLVWYGGSAAVAASGASLSLALEGLEIWAMAHPDQWVWIIRFGGAALNGGPLTSWPAVLGQLGRKGWNWWWNWW